MIDGITVSTTAITALLGGGGIGALVMHWRQRSNCEHCPDHAQHDKRICALEKSVAAIDAKLDLVILLLRDGRNPQS